MDVVVPGQGQTVSGVWNRESHFPQTLPASGSWTLEGSVHASGVVLEWFCGWLWDGSGMVLWMVLEWFCGWFWDDSVDGFGMGLWMVLWTVFSIVLWIVLLIFCL